MSLCLDKQVERELRSLPGNNLCCDCGDKSPQWASVSHGVFMCLECSGQHRSLGVHISFVRSVTMDSWNEKQIQAMRVGGNDRCNAFLSEHGVPKNTPIAQKYNTPAAAFFRTVISAESKGEASPPVPDNLGAANSVSEQEYIAQELRAREEARERLRQKFGGSTGLSSKGGVMQGFGSDPQPQQRNEEPSLEMLAEASQKAFTFISASVYTASEHVYKTTQAMIDEHNRASKPESTSSDSSSAAPGIDWSQTWSSLSSGASSLLSSASQATKDLLTSLNEGGDQATTKDYQESRSSIASGHESSIGEGSPYDRQEPVARSAHDPIARQPKPAASKGSNDDFFASFGV